ncbi:MAG: prolipoprotein diacylglyceryl transferase [Desulfobacteraceae bacterium]
MHPDLFSLGPLTIHTYGLFVALGFASAIWVSVWIGKNEGLTAQQVLDIGFLIVVWAIIGSRLLYILMNPGHYLEHPLDILKIWSGGLVFSGGLAAVVIVMIFYLRRRGVSVLKAGDILAPGIALGQGVGRIGCFMAGCCYGKPADVPWAVVFTDPKSLAPLNTPLHPTQLYSMGAAFALFGILLFIRSRKRFQGQVFIWFLILHSTARLAVERFRGDDRGLIPGTEMSVTQLVTLLVLLGAVAALYFLKPRNRDQV